MNKSKIMLNKHAGYTLFSSGKELLKNVEHNYLGQVVIADPKHEKEIWRRTGMGWGAFGKHS